MAALPDRFAGVAGRVPVVGEDAKSIVEPRGQVVEFGELILGERLGREKIEGPRVGVFKHGIEDREVVAKRLAGSGRSDNHEVLPGAGKLGRRCLVRVEAVYSLGAVGGSEFRSHPPRHWTELGFARRQVFDRGKDFVATRPRRKRSECPLEGIECGIRSSSQALQGCRHAASHTN
jgi:hypothetical protein